MLLVNDRAWDIQNVKKSANQDFYSVVDPITRFSRIFGIFPLILKGSVGNRKYSSNRLVVTYSLLVSVGMTLCLVILNQYGTPEFEKLAEYKVTLISNHFELVLNILLVAVIFLSIVFQREMFANAIDDLSTQDLTLRRLGSRLDYAADCKRHRIRLGLIILIVVLLFACDFIQEFKYNLRYFITWIIWSCPSLVRIFSACLFADIFIALRERFIALNDHVRKMIQEKNDLPVQYRICRRLRSVAMVHGILCETALSVNRIFTVSIVIEVIQIMITLTVNIYFIVHEIQNFHPNYGVIISNVDWGLVNTAHVIYLIIVCCMTKNQATLTGKLIHKLNAHEIDTPLNTVIQTFSLQLQHEKIEFSGAGLFPLDATMIQSIVGAVTTYLIILIQFDASKV